MVSNRVKAIKINDYDCIKKILLDPIIWEAITEDGISKENFVLDDKAEYIGIYGNSELIGLYILHKFNNATIQIHANILPQHRKNWALLSGFAILKYILESTQEQFQKVIAFVPENYNNVFEFCLTCGFTHEGTNRKSYRKNGELFDINLLGITRAEIKQWVSLKT